MEKENQKAHQDVFDGCRIVDGLAKDQWRGTVLGCALRFDGSQEENQRLKEFSWVLTKADGTVVPGGFQDASDLNAAIDGWMKDRGRADDPSVLLGNVLASQAVSFMKDRGFADGEEKNIEDFKAWSRKRTEPEAAVRALDEVAGVKQPTTFMARIQEIFRDIDSKKAANYFKVRGDDLSHLVRIVIDKNGGVRTTLAASAESLLELTRAGLDAGQEMAVTLSGSEVQAVTRMLLSMEGRIGEISEKLAERLKGVAARLAGRKDDGLSFKAGNALSAEDEGLLGEVEATAEEAKQLDKSKQGRLWDLYFESVAKGMQTGQLSTEQQRRTLAEAMGLGDPAKAVGRITSLAAGDRMVSKIIADAMQADLQTPPEAIVRRIIDARRQDNEVRRKAREQGDMKPLLSRYTQENYPIRFETLLPFVAARVQSIQAENLRDCEERLKTGREPSLNQLKLYTHRDLGASSIVKTMLGRDADPDLMSKAQGLLTNPGTQTDRASELGRNAPVQEQHREHGAGRTLGLSVGR